MTGGLHTILLIEDNGDDVTLIRRAFKKCNIVNPLQVVSDGDSAVDYLAGHGAYADRDRYPFPVLIVLDLKLPKRSGLEVLDWVRRVSPIKRIPVVILSSSRESRDLNTAYELGVNSYLVKPVSFEQLRKLVDLLHVYWILTNVPSDMGELELREDPHTVEN